MAGADDVDAAVRAARAAHRGWAALSPLKRARVLFRLADLLELHAGEAAELGALDNGTPISVMRPGPYAAAWVRCYAGWCDKLSGEVMSAEPSLSYVRLEPYGVVAVIPPWNGSMMGMGGSAPRRWPPATRWWPNRPKWRRSGCCDSPSWRSRRDCPRGCSNVVVGGAEAGGALAAHPGVDEISFTGGGATARALMASAAGDLTPLTLELGGKSPDVVFPDADLDTAATSAAFGTALLAGQGCAPPTRLYVHEDVYDEIVDLVLAALGSLAVGDPLDPATFVGPVVTEAAMERILATIDRARADEAELLAGGERLGGDLADGWFVAPTVLGDVDHRSDLARNEVFGPVQAVLRFTSDDDWPGQRQPLRARRLSPHARSGPDPALRPRIESGTVAVNGMGRISPATPFGGYKQSGFGREGGRAGIEEMVRRKTVFMAT